MNILPCVELVGKLIVDDVVHFWDVNAAGQYVSRHQNVNISTRYISHCVISLPRTTITVDGRHDESFPPKCMSNSITRYLFVDEYDYFAD